MTACASPIETLERLIAFPTVSSTSNRDITRWISEQLQGLGFELELSSYRDASGIEKMNLVARRDPVNAKRSKNDSPHGLAYCCHTDVVPANDWRGPGGDPFTAVLDDQKLYGRGACDMKGSLAAMMSAIASLPAADQRAPLWVICTADEEVGFGGAKQMVANSTAYRQMVDEQPMTIIGEPTRLSVVHAHKGIVGFQITSHGRAAHSSTRDGINANEAMVPMLQTLLELGHESKQHRYQDDRFDPPGLSWNFGVSDECRAINITPGKSIAWASLRPMPSVSGRSLVNRARDRAKELGLVFSELPGGDPFWMDPDDDSIQTLCRIVGSTAKTVCYGTDGGEFSELSYRAVIGPGDIAQAHTCDEFIELDQLDRGVEVFRSILDHWCRS